MNEIPEILARALQAPVTVTFPTADQARRWRYRVYNYIKRQDPGMRQLMMTQHDNEIRIYIPELEITSE
jgi:hypothetical protein